MLHITHITIQRGGARERIPSPLHVLLTSNFLPNFLIAVTHSVFNIMSSVIALNQIDGSELWKKVGFKPSEKVLVALRGVYNLPFNLDDPVVYMSGSLPLKQKPLSFHLAFTFQIKTKPKLHCFLLPSGEVYQKMHFLTYHYYF